MEPSRESRISVLLVNNDPAVRDMLATILDLLALPVPAEMTGADVREV